MPSYTLKSSRSVDEEEYLSYIRYLRQLGFTGHRLKYALIKYKINEAKFLSLIPAEEPVPPRLRENDYTVIDHAWVEGKTCSEIFKSLSRYQRWVCYLLVTESSYEEIMEQLGVSKTTLWRIINKISSDVAEKRKIDDN